MHRKLFGNAQNRELVDAVRDLDAEAYAVEPARVRQAAALRVQGVLYSNLWVNAGKPADSPLLGEEEEALYRGCAALKDVLDQ